MILISEQGISLLNVKILGPVLDWQMEKETKEALDDDNWLHTVL